MSQEGKLRWYQVRVAESEKPLRSPWPRMGSQWFWPDEMQHG
jgi:hypothetical protein